MEINNLKGEKLSNVYLYKNGEIKLIKELENVFIKNICTCSNSINILLKDEDNINKYNNTLIQINNECTNLKNGKSYINISYTNTHTNTHSNDYSNDYSTAFINNYVDSDLILYSIHEPNQKKIKVKTKTNTQISINDLKKKLIKTEKNNVWVYCLKKNQLDTKQDKGENEESENGEKNGEKNEESDVCTKYIPTNCREVYFCCSKFYAINDKNNICQWDIDISNNTNMIRYNYLSKFISYIKFTEKIIDISCGYNHALFLSQNKNCYAIGNNNIYQVSNQKTKYFDTPQLIKINKIKYIAAGHSHNLICTYKNEIYGWGNNMHKQIYLDQNFVKSPKLILNQAIWNSISSRTKKEKTKLREIKKVENCENCQSGESDKNCQSGESDKNCQSGESGQNEPVKEVKKGDKFEVKKLCCGFSFSCILMKNKNCYVMGVTDFMNNQNGKETKIETFKKINKKKKVDNIFCNFFDIILVEHLKITKVFPPIINPKLDTKIHLFFNFKIKSRHNLRLQLANQSLYNCKNGKKNHKKSSNEQSDEQSDEKINIDFHFNYETDQNNDWEKIKPSPKSPKSQKSQKSQKYDCNRNSQDYSSVKIDKKDRNKKLLIYLIWSNIILNYNKTIYVSEYEGKIKNIFPNNFALMKNLKIKIKINKVPIHINSDCIYVLYEYVDENNKNKIYKIIKGVMNKKRTEIYSKLPILLQNDINFKQNNIYLPTNQNNDTSEKNDTFLKMCSYEKDNHNYIHTFTKCNVYYSFGFNFYKNSFSMLFIKPEILNISPNTVNLHENNIIHINMAYLSKSFKFIYVILYNTNLNFIITKAYYHPYTNNYRFTIPLISTTSFKQLQQGIQKWQSSKWQSSKMTK
ncbi:CCAAT-box DNA binding protein subunit B [Plasmodium yoelii yoelii]|uniref:Regulator of chromosome condensation n=2 Tax=Plasmodium yoelii yoelii TaxID=73239 RepID=A0AAF0B5C5_PLAYO|nr:CCAAT-box DNA binding protein subunit B [Plasmodium yoelii yoelii]WBY57150.1 hypothetical protein Py17XNL_000900095 [Plasmodium yoelii yoelii]